MSESGLSPPLVGPETINIEATLPPRTGHRRQVLKPRSIVVINTSDAAVSIPRIDCDPVQDSPSGTVADASLEATAETSALASGESAQVTISGGIPSRAGAYVSSLRIQTEPGPPLVLPVALQIAASPVWGILCMLLGLAFVAVINMLAGESDVRARLSEITQFRQDANEWLDRNPPPTSQAANLDAFDLDIQRALILLGGPRPRSIIDWRIAAAQDRQRAAKDTLKTIKDAAAHSPPGGAEVADLDRQWHDLQARVRAAMTRDESLPGQTAGNLAGRLTGFLNGFKARYLDTTAQAELAALGTQVVLVDLALSAGQREQARQQAMEVRRWLERAAGEIDQRLRMVANYELMASFLLGEATRIRARLDEPGLPDDQRQAIADALDSATGGVSATTALPDLKNAYERVLDIGNRLLRLSSDTMVARLQAAVQRAGAETDLGPVQQAMTEDPPRPGDAPAAKIAFLRRVLAAWDAPLAAADADTQNAMRARIDAISTALDRGDLKATSPLYKELMQAWTDYGLRRIRDAVRAVTSDYCRREGEDLRRGLAMTEANLQLVRGNASLPEWEATVDRIRVQALAIPQEDCMSRDIRRKAGSFELESLPGSPLLGLQTDALVLSRAVFTASLADAPIGNADRLEAAGASGVQEAVELSRALAAGQRTLRLRLLTPRSDWYVGRPIQIQIDGVAQNWGAGVRVGLDFGDHTPPETKSAEDALKQPFVHTYTTPLTARTRVVAASGFRDGTLEVTGDQMGSGTLTFDIGVSPVSAARKLADAFLSIRFGLALLIALLVYFWQFRTNQKTFGSQSLDYVKAFVLGVVAEAAVSNLPEAFGKLVLG
jgi:hypothetical protein